MEVRKMKKEKKSADLKEISVQSFITTLDNDEQNNVKGGTGIEETEGNGTLVPVYC